MNAEVEVGVFLAAQLVIGGNIEIIVIAIARVLFEVLLLEINDLP